MTIRGQGRHAFPAMRVFIFGADITNDVTDASVAWNTGNAPNTCSISLLNKDDKYIFTSDDLLTVFKNKQAIVNGYADANNAWMQARNADNPLDKLPDQQTIDDQIKQSAISNIALLKPEIKAQVVGKKYTVTVPDVPAVEVDGTQSSQSILIGAAARYPFVAEHPIFHPNDPIRIFFRDPFNPKRWYHMFAGFASDFEDSVDENGQKILTITGEGPTKLLRYARLTTNPGILDITAIADSERDAVIRTVWQAGYANLTLPELVFTIIFGNSPNSETKFSIRRDSAQANTISTTPLSGVGNFNYEKSAILEYGPTSTSGQEDALQSIKIVQVDSLSKWQSLIDHEVKLSDVTDMAIPNFSTASLEGMVTTFADGTPDPTSIINIVGTHPEVYPVDGGRVLMLIPASFHPQTNREVLLRDMISNFRLQTEFSSRLGIIHDTIERIDFVFYESPKGDLIIEFPLYDFDPDDFELGALIPHQQIVKDGDQPFVQPNLNIERGPFGQRYIIAKHDTYNFARQLSDEKVRTQMVSYWSIIQNMDAGGTTREITKPQVISLKHLWPLYGIRTEQVPSKSYIASDKAALAMAHIHLNKMNADAVNLGINAAPNFGLWLNRPIQFLPRNLIGTTCSLTHSIKWGMSGSVDTRINLRYARMWDGLIDTRGRPLYTPIGGQASRPLDYKLLFKLKDAQSSSNPDTPQVSKSSGENLK